MADTEKVIEICEAYENGYTAGRMHLSSGFNGYIEYSDNYYAWLLGHNTGLQAELLEYDTDRLN